MPFTPGWAPMVMIPSAPGGDLSLAASPVPAGLAQPPCLGPRLYRPAEEPCDDLERLRPGLKYDFLSESGRATPRTSGHVRGRGRPVLKALGGTKSWPRPGPHSLPWRLSLTCTWIKPVPASPSPARACSCTCRVRRAAERRMWLTLLGQGVAVSQLLRRPVPSRESSKPGCQGALCTVLLTWARSPAEAGADGCSLAVAAHGRQAKAPLPVAHPVATTPAGPISGAEGRRGAGALRLSQLSGLLPPCLTWNPRCRRDEAGWSAAETQIGVKVPALWMCPGRGQALHSGEHMSEGLGRWVPMRDPEPQGPRGLAPKVPVGSLVSPPLPLLSHRWALLLVCSWTGHGARRKSGEEGGVISG